MSNCFSAQAEYDDHTFVGAICSKCGYVGKRHAQELHDQLQAAEAEASKYRGLYDESESAHTDAEAKLVRVRAIREGQVCSGCLDQIRDALDGAE